VRGGEERRDAGVAQHEDADVHHDRGRGERPHADTDDERHTEQS
jgi:hypothetical protein